MIDGGVMITIHEGDCRERVKDHNKNEINSDNSLDWTISILTLMGTAHARALL